MDLSVVYHLSQVVMMMLMMLLRVFQTMVVHGRDGLLSHPLCQNILSRKWYDKYSIRCEKLYTVGSALTNIIPLSHSK